MGDNAETRRQAEEADPRIGESDLSDSDDEAFEPGDAIHNEQLIRLVRTSAGSELFVNSVAEELMRGVGQTNWGSLLSSAPDALGRLGQCFVLASDPLASSLVFPESAGLPYKSLRANLVHCSDLGRKAFRGAEARMKKVSMVAQAVCEPDGTIDMIIQATEDEDLAELDLPDQLAALKRVSKDCIADTKAIKEGVAAWSKFANDVYKACVDQDETLGQNGHDLDGQIMDKRLAVQMKQERVSEVKTLTAECRTQLGGRQGEVARATKSRSRGVFTDLGFKLGETVIDTVSKALLSPLHAGSSIILGLLPGKKDSREHYAPEPIDPLEQQDAGYALAEALLPVVHRLAELLISGPDDLNGVDWEALVGRKTHPNARMDAIQNIQRHVRDVLHRFSRKPSQLVWQVNEEMKPVNQVSETLLAVIKQEQNVKEKTHEVIVQSARDWREQVSTTETALGRIISSGFELAKKEEAKKNQRKEARRRTTKMSAAELRFERLRMAQQALFDAETRLNQRLEEEMQALEAFNAMQHGLQKLLTSKATLVKDTVGECVKHLQLFCEKLDQLTSFFTEMQNYIDDIDKNRVVQFSQVATVTKKLGHLAKDQTDEQAQLRREKVKKQKLQQLGVMALQLKGNYLVAQAMADTYTEVSAKYIIPGVNKIDRLSLPDAKKVSPEERAQRIVEVGELATQARKGVKLLANARRNQFLLAMTEQRGVIDEAVLLEN